MTDLARIERVLFLQDVELLAHCDAEQVLRIAAIAAERRFATGDAIFAISDPSDAIHVVVEGSVQLQNPTEKHATVGTGDAFGVIDILSGRARTTNAVAELDTLTLSIDADDFFDLLSNNIEIVRSLVRFLADRVPTPLAW